MGRSKIEGFSNQSKFYLVTRHQLFKSDLEDYDSMEHQKIALTRSKLSLHLVNFQRTLKIHNQVYQRFHPARKKSKSSLFGSPVGANDQQQNLAKRQSFLPEIDDGSAYSARSQGVTLEDDDGTFKKLGTAITKLIRFNTIADGPSSILKDKQSYENRAKHLSPELLSRTPLYRQLVEKLQQTPLLTTLIPIRL